MQLGFTRWFGLAALALAAGSVQAQSKSKSYAAGHFALSLDGQPTLVRSIDGGSVKGETTATAVIEIDRVGADAMWKWLEGDWGQTKKTLVFPLAKKRRLDWTVGHVTEVKFPKLSASEKTPVSLTLVIAGQASTAKKGKLTNPTDMKQKTWSPANFRFRLGDLPTGRVSKIDSFTIKVGDAKGDVQVPPLSVTLDAADAGAWKVAVKSKHKKAGAIELTEDDGSVWKTVDLGEVVVSSMKGNVATLKVGAVSLH
jgi:hypothetical protein